MLDIYAVRLLLVAESLGYILAAWGWWRVWQQPNAARISIAASFTALSFLIKFVRIAFLIALSTPEVAH